MPSDQNPFSNTATILSASPGNNFVVGATGWSPSSGNMPSSQMLGMMPQPNSPALAMNPDIDLYGGMAMPFTQFVNGMPEQMSTTNISPSDHPCQGNGGTDCGSGRSCKENKQ